MHNIPMTQEEVDILYFVLYHCFGGNPTGPRKHLDTINEKLSRKVKNRKPCSYFSGNSHKEADARTRLIYIEEPHNENETLTPTPSPNPHNHP